ncbi:S41 family peptidase [Luteitalea pratensis]|uniref:S41 family peptidase n=1 Tax=Luteitalea pratensis TaxID=1855912 RepID=UPI0012FFD159|nr:S41 family peptidase [Luteitalea pratensis]
MGPQTLELAQTERLAGLARLWGAVKFFHPFLAYRDIDWDGALLKAIPGVKAARTPTEYRTAIDGMLAALGDPLTTAEATSTDDRPAPASPAEPVYFRLVDGHVVVHPGSWAQAMARGISPASAGQPQMMAEIAGAKGIVLDCRGDDSPPESMQWFYFNNFLNGLLPAILQGPVSLGSDRYRLHNGYAPQQGTSSGGYTSALLTETPDVILGQAKERKPVAVLIDGRTPELSAILSGVQAAGGAIVRVGSAGGSGGARTLQLPLPDGVVATVRLSEPVHPAGDPTLQPDVVLSNEAGAGEAGIRSAIDALNRPARERRAAALAPVLLGPKDNPYPAMPFPTEEYRLLALFRYWNVINYFFPYKHLIDKPWNTVLTEFIPRFVANTSELDYQMTIAEMVTRMQDSHGSARNLQALNDHLGAFAPAVRLVSAGGELTVAEVTDAEPTNAGGVARGDVIVSIDGQPVAERLAQLSKYRALSTPQSAYAYVYPAMLRGTKDTQVTVQARGIDGRVRDVMLSRTIPLASVSGMLPRKTPIYEVLPNGYGYIDLARLPNAEAHKALDAVLKTPAIVFDMRGYPNGTAWPLAPRLSSRTNVTAALFRRPLQSALNLDSSDLGSGAPDYAFAQKLPPAAGAIYQGKVVMLINEFAISQSEHTCLFFESATDVTFVGSPTNGANGDVTTLVLPGGIYVGFTGHDVRHADGRQLQRVGIQPHIKADPTPKGISEGRDDVLEAAIKHLDGVLRK